MTGNEGGNSNFYVKSIELAMPMYEKIDKDSFEEYFVKKVTDRII